MKKPFTFFLLTVIFVSALLADRIAGATDWHFGGYATASATATPVPTATPVFVQAANATGCTTNCNITLSSALPGDCVVSLMASGLTTAANGAGNALLTAAATTGAGGKLYLRTRTAIVGDGTSFAIPVVQTSDTVCIAAYRHVSCGTDGLSTEATGLSNTSPISGTITTGQAPDLVVQLLAWGGSVAMTTKSTGYTQRTTKASISGTNFGCEIDDIPAAAAGVVAASSGAVLAGAVDWAGYQYGLFPQQ